MDGREERAVAQGSQVRDSSGVVLAKIAGSAGGVILLVFAVPGKPSESGLLEPGLAALRINLAAIRERIVGRQTPSQSHTSGRRSTA